MVFSVKQVEQETHFICQVTVHYILIIDLIIFLLSKRIVSQVTDTLKLRGERISERGV